MKKYYFINEILKNGEVSYEAVNEMKYLDMVIEESLRLFPPVTRIDRVCNQNYEFENIKVIKGQLWMASVIALHYDEELYPNPEKFDPERFREQNKQSRENETYLPFGAGPRSCLGMRFSLLEIKILISSLLKQFKFVKCDETEVCLIFFS